MYPLLYRRTRYFESVTRNFKIFVVATAVYLLIVIIIIIINESDSESRANGLCRVRVVAIISISEYRIAERK